MSFKTALVTGGARGIGAAISKLLVARGTNVIVNYLSNKESAEQVVSELRQEKTRQAVLMVMIVVVLVLMVMH